MGLRHCTSLQNTTLCMDRVLLLLLDHGGFTRAFCWSVDLTGRGYLHCMGCLCVYPRGAARRWLHQLLRAMATQNHGASSAATTSGKDPAHAAVNGSTKLHPPPLGKM